MLKSHRVNHIIIFALAMVFAPVIAWANMGTPLIWLGSLHLFIGNLFIGYIEGILLDKINKVNKENYSSIIWMIIANYVSASIGYLIVIYINYINNNSILTINNLKSSIFLFYIIAWIFTILVEWPFVHIALKKAKIPVVTLKRSFKSSIILQTISYILIAPLYLINSSANLATQNTIDPSLSFVKNVQAVVYYISTESELYRVNIDGTGKEKLSNKKFADNNGFKLKLSGDKKYLDLYNNQYDKPKLIISKIQQISNKSRYASEDSRGDDTDLREIKKRLPEKIFSDYWGVSVFNNGLQHYRIDMPYAMWSTDCLTILPGNIMVFELSNQIVVWDYNNKKIGLLGRGSSPVVVYN